MAVTAATGPLPYRARRRGRYGRSADPARRSSRIPSLRARAGALPTGAAFIIAVASTGCSGVNTTDPPPSAEPVARLASVAAGLSSPVHLASPAGDGRIFIVEQPGRIRVLADGQLRAEPYLDITAQVGSGGERGLLSVAFHPAFATNGHFFVNYTDTGGTTRVERYTEAPGGERADAASAQLVLSVPQPYTNHNGGQLAFGPDGMLYIGMGDGGSGGDPHGYGQRLDTLLGKLLRIDVDRSAPYAVPPDNPLRDSPEARPEIWAFGLRNPWRFSFDFDTGMLYIADVGQSAREEINVRPATTPGLNYGWNVMEGSVCFPPGSGCSPSGLVLPVVEYAHGQTGGCSVTGGHVYRGVAIPALRGHYFYGDYCGGWVRSFRYSAAGNATDEQEWAFGSIGRITSFGTDAAGELYVLTAGGTVYQLRPGS